MRAEDRISGAEELVERAARRNRRSKTKYGVKLGDRDLNDDEEEEDDDN